MTPVQLHIPESPGFDLRTPRSPSSTGGSSFVEELGKAVASVDALQVNADVQADKVAHGAGNLHEAALALDKADIGMRVATKVRNKLVDTYQEIMRMSI